MRSWLKPETALKMSEADAAWLAGFFDGEGSIGFWKGGRGGQYPSLYLSVPNTHYPSVLNCQRIAGCGSVVSKPSKKKPIWHWRVTSQRDVISIAKQMLPYLVTKKERVLEILGKWIDVPTAA